MDAATAQWCKDSGLTTKTLEALAGEEFFTLETVKAMTVEVLDGFELSKAQACLLKKSVLKLQRADLYVATVNTVDNLDDTIANLESKLSAVPLVDQDGATGPATPSKNPSSEGKCLQSLRPHEALYIKPKRRPDGKEIKVQPTDLSYQEFLAGSMIIMERMLRDPTQSKEANEFCHYLKFVTQKATGFRTQAVLEFDDDFRSELHSSAGDATSFADVHRWTEIATRHFDAASALPRTIQGSKNQRPGYKARGSDGYKARGSDGKTYCFKWNQNSKNCSGCNYLHQCQVCDSADHGVHHHKKN